MLHSRDNKMDNFCVLIRQETFIKNKSIKNQQHHIDTHQLCNYQIWAFILIKAHQPHPNSQVLINATTHCFSTQLYSKFTSFSQTQDTQDMPILFSNPYNNNAL